MSKRITDTERLNWLSESKAKVAYVSGEVGPGWVRQAGWTLNVTERYVKYVKQPTLREAIDNAIRTEREYAESNAVDKR